MGVKYFSEALLNQASFNIMSRAFFRGQNGQTSGMLLIQHQISPPCSLPKKKKPRSAYGEAVSLVKFKS